jgi:hypothetical protein
MEDNTAKQAKDFLNSFMNDTANTMGFIGGFINNLKENLPEEYKEKLDKEFAKLDVTEINDNIKKMTEEAMNKLKNM